MTLPEIDLAASLFRRLRNELPVPPEETEDPVEQLAVHEVLDLARILYRAKKYRFHGDMQINWFESRREGESHMQIVGHVELPEALAEALRCAGWFDD